MNNKAPIHFKIALLEHGQPEQLSYNSFGYMTVQGVDWTVPASMPNPKMYMMILESVADLMHKLIVFYSEKRQRMYFEALNSRFYIYLERKNKTTVEWNINGEKKLTLSLTDTMVILKTGIENFESTFVRHMDHSNPGYGDFMQTFEHFKIAVNIA